MRRTVQGKAVRRMTREGQQLRHLSANKRNEIILVDPGSAQFRNVKAFLNAPTRKFVADIVCGEFNAKNSSLLNGACNLEHVSYQGRILKDEW